MVNSFGVNSEFSAGLKFTCAAKFTIHFFNGVQIHLRSKIDLQSKIQRSLFTSRPDRPEIP